jgi:spermidine synthase
MTKISSKSAPQRFLPLILAVFLISGACGLIYEVVWLKMLSLIFGVTSLAAATTLASFMAGLGLGGYVFGKYSGGQKHPLRLYALLELGVGAFAFLMPVILALLENVYVFAYREITNSYFWLSALRLILSFIVLMVPTFLMGGTLPVISNFLIKRSGELGKRISQLYFINTLGAVIGTAAAGFFLIYFLGVKQAAYAAGVFNVLVALSALIIDAKQSGIRTEARETAAADAGRTETGYTKNRLRLVLWAIGISGFCSLSYEVLWNRVLVYILDNTAHAFTTMLVAFLLGIALGSLAISPRLDTTKRLMFLFGALEAAIGFCALLSIPIFANFGSGIGSTGATSVYPTTNQELWAVIRLIRSLVVMLLPTFLLGMTIPIATRIYHRWAEAPGQAIGRIYAANTVGGVIGSFAAALLLLPLLGVYGSVILVAVINTVLGLGLIMSENFASARKKAAAAAAAILPAILTLALLLPQGRIIFSSSVERILPYQVLFYKEGAAATVKVYQDAFAAKSISIDGFPVAGTTTRHLDAQKSLGHLPLLLSSSSQPDINIIGFGAGGSSWAATLYDTGSIDVVELVPDVIEGARLIPEVNHGVMDDPRINTILGDGRNYLLLTDRDYDVISVDATSPKSAGSGSLYSLEFYQSCKSHLSSEGTMIEWLPYHLLNEDDVKMIARTFQNVFPHTTLWYSFSRHYYILIGTQNELKIDFSHLRQILETPAIHQELTPVGINDAYDVLACFLMGEEGLRRYAGTGLLNTDNYPRLEYHPATSYLNVDEHVRENLNATRLLRENASLFLDNFGDSDPAQVMQTLAERIGTTSIERYWPQYVN